MNKAELVSHVAADTSTLRADAERLVGAVLFTIADVLAREGHSSATGECIAIAASTAPSFKVGKTLRDAANPRGR